MPVCPIYIDRTISVIPILLPGYNDLSFCFQQQANFEALKDYLEKKKKAYPGQNIIFIVLLSFK